MFHLLLLPLACEAPAPASKAEEEEEQDETTVPLDWSDLYEAPEHAPQMTSDEVLSSLNLAFSYGLPEPLSISQNFFALLARGDDVCPASDFSLVGPVVPLSGCTSDSGYFYAGVATIVVEDTRTFAEDFSWTGGYELHTQSADFEIITPGGDRFFGGGQLSYSAQHDGVEERFSGMVVGSWQDSAMDAWLGEGISSTLTARGGKNADGETLALDGAIGIAGVYLYFDALTFLIASCQEAPISGAFRLRQEDGTWYVMNYDGGSCDTCTSLVWDGTEDLGEICPDFDAVFTLLSAMRSP